MVNLPPFINDAFSGMGQSVSNSGQTLMLWTGYILLFILVMGTILAVFYFIQFRIKAIVFPLYGASKDNYFTVGREKTNKFRWIKKRTAWRPLKPLFNKKEIEPFDSEYILPGNRVYCFELNGQYIPGRINVDKTEQEIRGGISPVPYYQRGWQSLQYKKDAQDYAEHNFWADNKFFFMTIITAALCLVMVGVTVYYCTHITGTTSLDMRYLADTIRGAGVIK